MRKQPPYVSFLANTVGCSDAAGLAWLMPALSFQGCSIKSGGVMTTPPTSVGTAAPAVMATPTPPGSRARWAIRLRLRVICYFVLKHESVVRACCLYIYSMTARRREEHVSPRESWKKQEAVYLVGQPKQARKAASARATCHLALLAVCDWSIFFQHISSVIYCCTICRRRCAPENDTIRACLASPCATISEQ